MAREPGLCTLIGSHSRQFIRGDLLGVGLIGASAFLDSCVDISQCLVDQFPVVPATPPRHEPRTRRLLAFTSWHADSPGSVGTTTFIIDESLPIVDLLRVFAGGGLCGRGAAAPGLRLRGRPDGATAIGIVIDVTFGELELPPRWSWPPKPVEFAENRDELRSACTPESRLAWMAGRPRLVFIAAAQP
jgi:hypothetical protein